MIIIPLPNPSTESHPIVDFFCLFFFLEMQNITRYLVILKSNALLRMLSSGQDRLGN